MLKKLIFCLYVGLLVPTLVVDATPQFLSVVTEYIHGFTGQPSGALEMVAAFPNPQNFQAAALPDTKKETGYGLNRLISYCGSFWKKNVSRSYAYMADGQDVEAIHEHVQQNIGTQPMVLFGNCRGGTAALNYVTKYNPDNLKAIVCEAMTGDLVAVLHPILSRAGLDTNWDATFFRFLFPSYPKDAISPLHAVEKITNKKLPVLLLHSREDKTIPFVHALRLYATLKKNGFENVHLVVLPGKHVYLLRDCQQEYLTAVHSFYKHYGLEHNPKYATADMQSYRYDVEQAQREVEDYETSMQMQRKQTRIALAALSTVGIVGIAAYQNLKSVVVDGSGLGG